MLEEVSCTLCERKKELDSRIRASKDLPAKKEKEEITHNLSEIGKKIGVIDTIVTRKKELAAVGLAIIETEEFQIIDAASWKIYLYGNYPDLDDLLCYPSSSNEKSFFYENYKSIIDNASTHEGTKADCILGLSLFLNQYGVTSLFAYNGTQIKQQLIVLDNVEWFELKIPFTAFRSNRFITPYKIMESYARRHCKEGDYRVEEDGSVWYKKWPTEYYRELPKENFITIGKAGLCVIEPEEFADVMKCIPECENYEDTSNALFKVIDKAAAMGLMNISASEYLVGRLNDTYKEILKRREQAEQYRIELISFVRIVAMSYEELVEHLRAKYGPVEYDYFPIESRSKFEESESIKKYRIKRGNSIYDQGKAYPIGIKGTFLDNAYFDNSVYMMDGQKRSVFEMGIYWFYQEEDVYITWNRNRNNSRADEGLVIHHIDEDKAEFLSDPRWAYNQPVAFQRKERLIYCDLIEHYLLHLKCGSKCGTVLIEKDIKRFLDYDVDQDWQIPCARRVRARAKDIDLMVEKEMIFKDRSDES